MITKLITIRSFFSNQSVIKLSEIIRKGGRVVECGGLENRCSGFRNRGFESPPFRNKYLLYIYIPLFLCLIFFPTKILHAQSSVENWVSVSIENDKSLYINVTGLSEFQDNEIYVWSLEEVNPPLTMEEVNGDIYKIKTYYHIDKELFRYGIMQIIYYDKNNNVMKHYNYNRTTENPEFIYNYPIIKNSDVYKILEKCLEYITSDENHH